MEEMGWEVNFVGNAYLEPGYSLLPFSFGRLAGNVTMCSYHLNDLVSVQAYPP